MASKYWLKLYHEMQHDPKIIRLSDRLFRRTIQAFLAAGDLDKDGLLPSLEDMSITLRTDPEQLETDFVALSDVGILSLVDTNWTVTKFAERQEPVSSATRMKQYRERKQKQQYYGDDTPELPDCDEPVTIRNADIDIDIDKKKKEYEWDIPERLNHPQFIQAWDDFQKHRKEIKKKLTPLAGSRTLKKLEAHSSDIAIQMLEQSIENGWTGVFEVKPGNNNQPATIETLEKAGYNVR